MHKLRFTGTIYPRAIKTSIENHPTINWKSGDPAFSLNCDVKIQDNNVTIDCEVDNFEKEKHLTPIVMRAYDTARATIDLMSFASGNGLVFVLDTFTDPDGKTTVVAPQQPDLAALSTAVARPEDFDKVLRLILTEPPVFLALRDLIDAITQWHRAPVNTARVLDGLRNLIAPGEEPKKSWSKLRALLRVEESYLKFVTDTSAAPRHGDPTHISGAVTRDVSARAWTMFNRYLEYRKRGNQPLPESEFPILR